jgi:hypothetical protein
LLPTACAGRTSPARVRPGNDCFSTRSRQPPVGSSTRGSLLPPVRRRLVERPVLGNRTDAAQPGPKHVDVGSGACDAPGTEMQTSTSANPYGVRSRGPRAARRRQAGPWVRSWLTVGDQFASAAHDKPSARMHVWLLPKRRCPIGTLAGFSFLGRSWGVWPFAHRPDQAPEAGCLRQIDPPRPPPRTLRKPS